MPGFTQLNYHKQFTSTLVQDFKKRLQNPYYLFTDKKQTLVNYYNLNMEETTVGPGIDTHYSNLGSDSPLRFNVLRDFYLYGISRAEINGENNDFGLEAGEISGEAIILPNTITPFPNDYFSINYLDEDILFKVISVTPDTLPNGANFYKIEYKLDQHNWEEGNIKHLIINTLFMKIEYFGTNRRLILTKEEIEYGENIDKLVDHLQTLYKDIFYDTKILNFAFDLDGAHFYDPFLIEFLKKNDILKSEKFLYFDHSTVRSKYFNLEYNHTIFKAIETGKLDNVKTNNNQFCGLAVEEPNSLLSHHSITYYQMTYDKSLQSLGVRTFYILSPELFTHIIENKLYEKDIHGYNILINYFNGVHMDKQFFTDAIENLDIMEDKNSFYFIPFIIYIMNKQLSLSLTSE